MQPAPLQSVFFGSEDRTTVSGSPITYTIERERPAQGKHLGSDPMTRLQESLAADDPDETAGEEGSFP
jgi:hypothetical protein